MKFKDASKNIKERKKEMEYKFEYKKMTAGGWTEEKKRMRCMAYVARSRPKSKLVTARLTNRQTNKVTFGHFSMTGKKIKKEKKKRGKETRVT